MKISEQHNIIEDEEEDAEYLVDAILGFKSAGKKGYELLVKWQGYEVGNDTSWEPAKTFLQQWDCESSEIYDFFKRENIDVSKCNDFDFIARKPRRKTEQKNKKKKLDGKTRNIQCSDIRDDEKVPEGDGNQNKEYICDLEHTAKAGSLKGEDNPTYADLNYFLNGKKCSICDIPFEGSEKLDVKSFKISSKNLVYACVDQACNYFMCGDCYKIDLLKDD